MVKVKDKGTWKYKDTDNDKSDQVPEKLLNESIEKGSM